MTRIIGIGVVLLQFLAFISFILNLIATTNDEYYHWLVLVFWYMFVGGEAVLVILVNYLCLDTPKVAIGIVLLNKIPASLKVGTVGKSGNGSDNEPGKNVDVID